MGAADRAIRLLLVALVAILYFTDNITGTAAIILGILAVVFMFTSFTGFCPMGFILKKLGVKESCAAAG